MVAGAGHNSLLTACYLAKAGYRCLVLDARSIPGGGAATEELLLPGFGIDTCATGHTMIRVNPALLHDELGLIADYGLRYVEPDPVEQVAFPDGEQFTMWLDRERTAEEVARFSREDAAAYRRLLDDYDEVKALFSRWQFTPVGYGPDAGGDARRPPAGTDLGPAAPAARRSRWSSTSSPAGTSRRSCSGWPTRCSSRWTRPAPACCPTSRRSAASSAAGRSRSAGPASLTAALTGYLEDHGGTILCGRRVTRLLLEDGRCTGVETDDGEQYLAGTAVVSTIHVKHLRDMAPAASLAGGVPLRGGHLRRGGARVRHLLLHHGGRRSSPPRTGRAPRCPPGLAGWPEEMIQLGADLRAGRYIAGPAVGAGGHPDAGRPGPGTRRAATPSRSSARRPTGSPAPWAAGTNVKEEHSAAAARAGCAGTRPT